MVKKQYRVIPHIPAEPEEPLLFRSREQAEERVAHMKALQPENRYEIEEEELDIPRDAYLRRYPRIVAHLICESVGYATPHAAAWILKDANEGQENACEWVASCYRGDARAVVQDAIKHRHHHKGYMAEYKHALAIVKRQIETGEGPTFASWF